jgi:hypothetical protein
MSDAIPTDVLERMQVWVGCGRTKESFGQMTEKESAMYDKMVAARNAARAKKQTTMIVHDYPDFHFNL